MEKAKKSMVKGQNLGMADVLAVMIASNRVQNSVNKKKIMKDLIKLYTLQSRQYFNNCLKFWVIKKQSFGMTTEEIYQQKKKMVDKNEAKIRLIQLNNKDDLKQQMDELLFLSLSYKNQIGSEDFDKWVQFLVM